MTNRDICGVEDCIGCTPCTVGMLHRYICIIMAKETNTMYTLLYDICTVSWLCLYIIHSHVQVVRQGTFTRSMSPPPSPVPCLSRATKRLLIFLLLKKNTKIYIYIYIGKVRVSRAERVSIYEHSQWPVRPPSDRHTCRPIQRD